MIYNGSIAFAITGLFLGAAGWATFDSGVLPRWTGWIAYVAAASCAASVPAMYFGPVNPAGFYNAGGWGAVVVANFPPLIWFLIVGIILVRKRSGRVQQSVRTAAVARRGSLRTNSVGDSTGERLVTQKSAIRHTSD